MIKLGEEEMKQAIFNLDLAVTVDKQLTRCWKINCDECLFNYDDDCVLSCYNYLRKEEET